MEPDDDINISGSDSYNGDNNDNNYNFNLDSSNSENIKYENSDENHIILNTTTKIWCMLKLNKIAIIENNEYFFLNLVALGLSSNKILIINLNEMKIYQEINTVDTVYSLTQFKDDSNYLICSLSNGQMIIYILKDNQYKEFQVLEKPKGTKDGEINKVITLSDGSLATAERDAVSIWKPKIEKEGKKFEFFKELITDNDTCHILEVNPQVFACAVRVADKINVYKNDGNEYPLLGSIDKVLSHGYNSNGMTKINDNTFCSGGLTCVIYVISIEPVQVIQKISLDEKDFYNDYILFLYKSNDGFIFTSTGKGIIQLKIIKDEDNNFIRLEKFDIIEDGISNTAISLIEGGKIFYKQKIENLDDKTNLFLTKYKQLDN